MENQIVDVDEKRSTAVSRFNHRIFVFSGETFEAALADWVEEQLSAYPHKEELIRITELAMRDFMTSEHIRRHKMALKDKDLA